MTKSEEKGGLRPAMGLVAVFLVLAAFLVWRRANAIADLPRLTVGFPRTDGLRVGNPVRVLGHGLGRVESIAFDRNAPEERRMIVVLRLEIPVELRAGARFAIEQSTRLGGRHVGVYPGDVGGPPLVLGEGELLLGELERDPIAALDDLGRVISENVEGVRSIREDFDEIVSGVQEGRGTVGRYREDGVTAQGLSDTLASIESVADQVGGGEGLVAAMIDDEEFVDRAREVADRFFTLGDELEAGTGLAGKMLNDDDFVARYESARDAFTSIAERFDEGAGLAARLEPDSEMRTDLESMMEGFESAFADLDEVVGHYQGGEGSLALIIERREKLADQAQTGFAYLTRSLEDFREAAAPTFILNIVQAVTPSLVLTL